jgi:asparagine N-glycosylation enzyme membrane subunit Stt3
MTLLKETTISLFVVILFLLATSENPYFPYINFGAVAVLYAGAWKAGVFKGVWR